MTKKIIFLLFFMVFPGVFAAKQDVLRVATSPDAPPFEFYDTVNKKLQGFDIDLVREISKRLNAKLDIIESDFSNLIGILKSDRADIAIASMSATAERAQSVDFTNTYVTASFVIVTRDKDGYFSLDDFKGKRIGVQLGTPHENFLRERAYEMGDDAFTIVPLNKIGDAVQETKVGRIQGAIMDAVVGRAHAKQNDQLRVIDLKEGTSLSIAVRQGSPWLHKINRAIKDMQNDGFIEKLSKKWFSGDALENLDMSEEVSTKPFSASIPYILGGVFVTLKYTGLSLILGLTFGSLLALFKLSKYRGLEYFARLYTSIFRGTPLILQLSLVYFASPQIVGHSISPFTAGVITFSLNSAAYISEIIRAGVLSVDKGQFEASYALGVPYRLMMKDIIFPQAFKNILPALANEGINLLKETALVSVIGEADLMRRATIVSAEKYLFLEPLLVAGACYYVMVVVLSFGVQRLEKRLKRSD